MSRGLAFREVPDAEMLSVGDHVFKASEGEPALSGIWRAASEAASGRRPLLVKFDAPPKVEWTEALERAGAEIVQYQPRFGFLVFVPPGFEPLPESIPHLVFSGEYHAAYKARKALRDRSEGGEILTLRVIYFDLPGYEKRIDAVMASGARLIHLSGGHSTSAWSRLHYVVYEDVQARDLPSILRAPQVYWAEEWHPLEPDDERAAQIAAGNLISPSPFEPDEPVPGYHAWLASLGADGSGVTIAVADTGLSTGDPNTVHEDFAGRVTYATSLCSDNRDLDGHGTNVAAIAAGDPRLPGGTGLVDSESFLWGAGSAPGSHIYVQKAMESAGECGGLLVGEPNTLAEDAVRLGGARIGNHSFRDTPAVGNDYTATAQAWDARVRDADSGTAGNQPYTVVFSAGNDGSDLSTLSSPHTAKNILTVGASENFRPSTCLSNEQALCGGSADDVDAVARWSSRGPTDDGRIKPDLVAPGHVVAGGRSSAATYTCVCDGGLIPPAPCCQSEGVDGWDKYTLMSGTSMSAPRVAGVSALVHEWFQNRFGAFPSPAMNKAILINGAVDMANPDMPNMHEGWGRVHLRNSLQDPLPAFYVDQTNIIETSGDPGVITTNLTVQDPTEPLKATLVWTDPPAAVGCMACLVNDLDLRATQGATTWLGNSLTNGFSNTSGTPDSVNNIEVIHLPGGTLDCSAIAIEIEAQSLNGDGVPGTPDPTDQDYALVVSNASPAPTPAMSADIVSVSGGCDGDAFLDRLETVDLVLDLVNQGCADAASVTAELTVESAPSGATVTVSPPGPQPIGLVPAQSTTQQAWQVSLGDDPRLLCGETVTLRVGFADGAGRLWSDLVEVALDRDSGITPVSLVDPADTDESFSRSPYWWNLNSCRFSSPSTSWHMGNSDCTGIQEWAYRPHSVSLIFDYPLGPADVLRELSFQHAFFTESGNISILVDHDKDGVFQALEGWPGSQSQSSMTLAGPYDLSIFNDARADSVRVRFRYSFPVTPVSATAPGWDVDDITFAYDEMACDVGACPGVCMPASGIGNIAASVVQGCGGGVDLTWPVDPNDWRDGGIGARSYVVLRDGAPVPSGGCSGAFAYGSTSCTDDDVAYETTYEYRVQYQNGCGGVSESREVVATCGLCQPVTGLTNNTASDVMACLGGVEVSWAQDASDWGDIGSGTRTYEVLRDGVPLSSGGCSGSLSYGTTSCVDETAAPESSHLYQVRYANGCGRAADTAGTSFSCPLCGDLTGLPNNTVTPLFSCAAGIQVSWAQDPSDWGDFGFGTRSYEVLRDGLPMATGGCGGVFAYGTTTCVDGTVVPGGSYTYQVGYLNDCGSTADTAGASFSCPLCEDPTGLPNVTGTPLSDCAAGIQVSWAQDPSDWGDFGFGTRSYEVLRDGLSVATGGCSGVFPYGTTTCVDDEVVQGGSYTYQVRYLNDCGHAADTAGAATPCPCYPPSGMANNSAMDALDCLRSGIEVGWDADPADWGDFGFGSRGYVVHRDGVPLSSGGCSGTFSEGSNACHDDTAFLGANHEYKVQYANGCGTGSLTPGATAKDQALAPPPVNDGTSGGNPVTISISGSDLSLSWDSHPCALEYNLYMGTIGSYWDHQIFSANGLDGADSCREPANTVTFTDPGGNVYFLVAAKSNLRESTLGSSTVQDPRPYASPACSPH